MGQDNSKPDDVSDAAWERYQDKKLDIVREQITEKENLQKEVNDKLLAFNVNFIDYCSACHDVPKPMMVFPSYREKCSLARGKLIGDMTGLLLTSNNIETTNQMIKKINKM
jgi:hypothetical protein